MSGSRRSPSLVGAPLVPLRAQQQEQARRPPAPTAKDAEPHSAAGAVDATGRTRVGDRTHPLGRRTTRQNDGHRHPGRSAERHVSARSSAGHRLHRIRRSDVGSDNPEPSICLRGPRNLVMAPDAQMERSVMLKKHKHCSGGAAGSPTPSWQQGSPRSGMRTNHRRSDQRPGGKGQDRGTCQPNPVLLCH